MPDYRINGEMKKVKKKFWIALSCTLLTSSAAKLEANAITRVGYRLFAVKNNDTCSADATAAQKAKKLKECKKCGFGDTIGHNAFQVYTIRGNFKVRAQSRSPLQH